MSMSQVWLSKIEGFDIILPEINADHVESAASADTVRRFDIAEVADAARLLCPPFIRSVTFRLSSLPALDRVMIRGATTIHRKTDN